MGEKVLSLITIVALTLGLTGFSVPRPRQSVDKTSGLVDVVYAGSLEALNNLQIGPAFEHATHFHYQGQGGGSLGMAQEIKSLTLAPNVFESIGYAPIQVIEPKDTTWAVSFASSPLVVAYSPFSKYANELNAIRDGRLPLKDLFTLMASSDFHLGRTNPNTDPQGQAFYMMVELAVKHYHLGSHAVSRILGRLDNPKEVYSEEGILTLLQSGGLDASSAFLSEAIERHLDYIALPNWMNFAVPNQARSYRQATLALTNGHTVRGQALTVDITTVGNPTPPAVAFIHFVLGVQSAKIMRVNGYRVFSPTVLGKKADVPANLLPHQ